MSVYLETPAAWRQKWINSNKDCFHLLSGNQTCFWGPNVPTEVVQGHFSEQSQGTSCKPVTPKFGPCSWEQRFLRKSWLDLTGRCCVTSSGRAQLCDTLHFNPNCCSSFITAGSVLPNIIRQIIVQSDGCSFSASSEFEPKKKKNRDVEGKQLLKWKVFTFLKQWWFF